MFISSIRMKEFRGIKECKSAVSLSKFTVLLGRNNSGKSAVLEALSLFPDYRSKKLYSDESPSDFLASLHGGYNSLIYGYSGNAELNCTILNEKLRLLISENNQFLLSAEDEVTRFKQDGQRVRERDFTTPESVMAKISNCIDGDNYSQKLTNATFFLPNNTTFMDKLQVKIKEDKIWNMVTKKGANSTVIDLVNRCVDDKYSEVLRTPELSARKERGKERLPIYIKIKDLGEGIQKVVTTALWLEALNPQLILWDDFEGSAHPSLINVLIDWIAKKPWQVVISTHSFDVISSVLDIKPEDTTVIQLKKTNDDILIQNTLSMGQLDDIVDSSQDPRKLVDLLQL